MAETRDILRRMAWQVHELGLHRKETAEAYPPEARVERMLWATLYNDRCVRIIKVHHVVPLSRTDEDLRSPRCINDL